MKRLSSWTALDIQNQKGPIAVVMGTRGLGLQVALELARFGCDVINRMGGIGYPISKLILYSDSLRSHIQNKVISL